MKQLLFSATFILLFHSVFAQGLKPREYKTLNRMGLEISPVQTNTPQSISTLQEILKKERQVKVNKSLGIVFSVFSAASLGFGTTLLIANRGKGSGSDVMVGTIGTIMMVSGGIYAGVSIPLLLHAKIRKKQRDRLIRSFKAIH